MPLVITELAPQDGFFRSRGSYIGRPVVLHNDVRKAPPQIGDFLCGPVTFTDTIPTERRMYFLSFKVEYAPESEAPHA